MIYTLTWHSTSNIGSTLQAYALQFFLLKNGYHSKVLNYFDLEVGGKRHLFYKIFTHKFNFIFGKWFNLNAQFITNNISTTKQLNHKKDVELLFKKNDLLIVGSDQIWNPIYYDPVYYGLFNKDIYKMSYAPSIGVNFIEDKYKNYYRDLKSFDFLSCREQEGVTALKNILNRDVHLVIDPSLLLEIQDYNRISCRPNHLKTKKFCFVYFLNGQERQTFDEIKKYCIDNNLFIVGRKGDPFASQFDQVLNIGPSEFIYLINKADSIFTNSYHCICFSLLFHKKFYSYYKFNNLNKNAENSRINQLIRYFNIERLVLKDMHESIPNFSYNWNNFENKLINLKKSSSTYLLNSIQSLKLF